MAAGNPNCEDVPAGPGEYVVSEAPAVGILDPGSTTVGGDCVQDPTDEQRATGEIQGGETQICRFINEFD